MDIISCAAPIGIFLGRITNFINSELWGKTTSLPWGVVFPNGGPNPRHPTQIYEAFLEGLVLFLILNYFYRKKYFIEGYCASIFLILYGVFRILIEFIRVPDNHIGYLLGNFLTNGILLSVPMMLLGCIIFLKVNDKYRKNIKK